MPHFLKTHSPCANSSRHEAADSQTMASFPSTIAAVANHEAAWSPDEMMRRLDGHQLRYSPGAGWRYSNVAGCMLVAKLIERAGRPAASMPSGGRYWIPSIFLDGSFRNGARRSTPRLPPQFVELRPRPGLPRIADRPHFASRSSSGSSARRRASSWQIAPGYAGRHGY